MKITKEHVGKKVRRDSWDADEFVVVIAVGNLMFIASRKDGVLGEECFTDLKEDWQFYEEPKKYKIVSPATKIIGKIIEVTREVFETKEECEKFFYGSYEELSWPALDANRNAIQYFVEVKG